MDGTLWQMPFFEEQQAPGMYAIDTLSDNLDQWLSFALSETGRYEAQK